MAQVKTLLSKSLKELQSVAAGHHVAGDLEQELAKAQEMGRNALPGARFIPIACPTQEARCLDVGYELLNEMGIRAYNQTYLNEQDATPGNQGSEDGMSWGQFAESLGISLAGDAEPASQIAESMGMDEQTLREWMGKKGIVISTPKATRRASQPAHHDSFGSRLIASWITEISEWLNEDYARSKGGLPMNMNSSKPTFIRLLKDVSEVKFNNQLALPSRRILLSLSPTKQRPSACVYKWVRASSIST